MIWLQLFMWAAHTGDMVSTHFGLAAGCTELNPFYYILGFWGLVGLKAFSIGLLSLWASRDNKPWVLIMAGVLGWGAVAWNTLTIVAGGCNG